MVASGAFAVFLEDNTELLDLVVVELEEAVAAAVDFVEVDAIVDPVVEALLCIGREGPATCESSINRYGRFSPAPSSSSSESSPGPLRLKPILVFGREGGPSLSLWSIESRAL